jgi:hypothetical protein
LSQAMCAGRTVGRIGMTVEAREDWRSIYSALSADRLGLAGALLARAEAQVSRLAALYAVLDGKKEVEAVHLSGALALWKHAEQSVELLFGDQTGDPVADTIFEALKKGPMNDTGISRLFSGHQPAARLEAAKRMLLDAGKIHFSFIETDGRPIRTWEAGRGS